jgi:hypothetical protein
MLAVTANKVNKERKKDKTNREQPIFGSKRRRQIVTSTPKPREITLTLQSGDRIKAETSSNAAAGFCCREATVGDLFTREMLAEKRKIRRDHTWPIPEVCRA